MNFECAEPYVTKYDKFLFHGKRLHENVSVSICNVGTATPNILQKFNEMHFQFGVLKC